MSQGNKISHIPSLYYTTLQMDYLIICDDDPCAAKILKLFEVWSKDKDSAIEQARYHNAAAQKEGLLPSHDESHWLYNTIPNLQRRLLFEYGEKTIAKSLKLLQTKEFITIRNNPQYKWDRTKQYQFHTQAVQQAIYGITVEQITPYYAGFDPIKAETLAAIDTAKMRDANRLKCGMHDAKVRLQSGTKEGDETAKVRDDPNSLSISYSNSSLTPPLSPQGEPEQESEESKPIESNTPEPSPTPPSSVQTQPSLSTQPITPHENQSSGASLVNDKTINEPRNGESKNSSKRSTVDDSVFIYPVEVEVCLPSDGLSGEAATCNLLCNSRLIGGHVFLGDGNRQLDSDRVHSAHKEQRFPKDVNGKDCLPWELRADQAKALRSSTGDKTIQFHPDFEKHMARSLMKTTFYQSLMYGEMMTAVRKHISVGKHNPERLDQLLIEWNAMNNAPNTIPDQPKMTAKGAARRAKIASALSINPIEE